MAPKIYYNPKEKILSLRLSQARSVDSDVQDNVVVDYDKEGRVVNVEVMEINLRDFMPIGDFSRLAVKPAI